MSSGQRFQLSNLAPEYRRAGVIAVLLFATMFLPWYTVSAQTRSKKTGELVQHHETLRAFQSFSLVEAAILLVAISILALLFVRGQKRPFHLPGGDGLMIAAGGAWVCFLVAYRFVDNKQGNPSDILVTVDYGVTWGIFVTFLVGLLLVHAGLRIRAAHISEPPNPTATMPMARKAKPRPRSPLEVDEDTHWTEDEATQVTSEGKAVDPLRYDDPV
jgi:hypothetical protein